jgi:Amt family ammonium transporter
MVIGVAAGLIPWFFCFKVKAWFGYDDALDTFGVHAIGGTLGALLTGMLARTGVNSSLTSDWLKPFVTNSRSQPLVFEQLKAVGVTLVLACVGTAIIAFIVKAIVGLRPSEEVETAGLDLNEHGEEGYHVAAGHL